MNRNELLEKVRELAAKYEKTCDPGDGYGHELVLKDILSIPATEAVSRRHTDLPPDSIYAFFSYRGEIHCGTVNGWDITPYEFTDAFLEKFLNYVSDDSNLKVF